jgi:hypothetical protein
MHYLVVWKEASHKLNRKRDFFGCQLKAWDPYKIVHPFQRSHHAYICNDQGTVMCAYVIPRNHHTCIKSFLLPRGQHVFTVHMSFIPLKELQTIVYATTCISWLLYWGLEGIWLYSILKKRMFVCSQSGIIHRKM